MNGEHEEERILVVDDCDMNVDILQELLGESYTVESACDGEECLAKLHTFCPDLVLLDIMMPKLDGYQVCERIKSSPIGPFTQVVLVSGKASAAERNEGYRVGADDYLIKPFDHEELLAKVRVQFRLRSALVRVWHADARLRNFNAELEQTVRQRTEEIVATQDVAIFAMAKLAESRDPETGRHLERMRRYSQILAEELAVSGPYTAEINEQFVSDLYRSSPLHDVGKTGIADGILLKPGRLTRAEFEIMKQHSTIGAETLAEAVRQSHSGSFLRMAVDIARHHHERFDGRGYPDGLAGQAIPLSARIVTLADVFDALTSRRVYKPAYDPEIATRMILEERGRQFDPAVVDAFEARLESFLRIAEENQQREAALVGQ